MERKRSERKREGEYTQREIVLSEKSKLPLEELSRGSTVGCGGSESEEGKGGRGKGKRGRGGKYPEGANSFKEVTVELEEPSTGSTVVVVVVVVTVEGVMVKISFKVLLPLAASKLAARVVNAFDASKLPIND